MTSNEWFWGAKEKLKLKKGDEESDCQRHSARKS